MCDGVCADCAGRSSHGAASEPYARLRGVAGQADNGIREKGLGSQTGGSRSPGCSGGSGHEKHDAPCRDWVREIDGSDHQGTSPSRSRYRPVRFLSPPMAKQMMASVPSRPECPNAAAAGFGRLDPDAGQQPGVADREHGDGGLGRRVRVAGGTRAGRPDGSVGGASAGTSRSGARLARRRRCHQRNLPPTRPRVRHCARLRLRRHGGRVVDPQRNRRPAQPAQRVQALPSRTLDPPAPPFSSRRSPHAATAAARPSSATT